MGGGGNESRWLISYADLVTLLMAFFVALYGISHSDQKKFNDFLKGLGAFGNPAAANSGILTGGPSIVGSGTGVGNANAGTEPAPVPAGTTTTVVGQLTKDFQPVVVQIRNALKAAGLASSVTFTVESRGLVATIATDDVLFQTGSAQISGEGAKILAAIGPTLAGLPNDILIEGHTDDVPLTRPNYTNWNLSTDRAVAVLESLQATFGIDPSRLSAAGYGPYKPVATNTTAAGRALNRRVEVVILTSQSGQDAGPAGPTAGPASGTGAGPTAGASTPIPTPNPAVSP